MSAPNTPRLIACVVAFLPSSSTCHTTHKEIRNPPLLFHSSQEQLWQFVLSILCLVDAIKKECGPASPGSASASESLTSRTYYLHQLSTEARALHATLFFVLTWTGACACRLISHLQSSGGIVVFRASRDIANGNWPALFYVRGPGVERCDSSVAR